MSAVLIQKIYVLVHLFSEKPNKYVPLKIFTFYRFGRTLGPKLSTPGLCGGGGVGGGGGQSQFTVHDPGGTDTGKQSPPISRYPITRPGYCIF